MDEAKARRWERTRRWGIGVYCIPRISAVFIVISIIDFFLVDSDWVRLAGELRENFLVAAVAGIVFSVIDWRQNEKRYREFKQKTHF
jgi:hypothetical protein